MKRKNGLEQHKFLKILHFAYNNSTFTEKEICKDLNLTWTEFKTQVAGIAHHDPNHDGTGDQKWTISYDAFINYLEYIELNDARRSSKIAIRIAIVAIGISILSTCVSIHYSRKQLERPTKIEQMQFETIEKLAFNPIPMEERMDIILDNQGKLVQLHNTYHKKMEATMKVINRHITHKD